MMRKKDGKKRKTPADQLSPQGQELSGEKDKHRDKNKEKDEDRKDKDNDHLWVRTCCMSSQKMIRSHGISSVLDCRQVCT